MAYNEQMTIATLTFKVLNCFALVHFNNAFNVSLIMILLLIQAYVPFVIQLLNNKHLFYKF